MVRFLGVVLFAAVAVASSAALVAADAVDPTPDAACASTCASEYVACGTSCTMFTCQPTCSDAYWSCLKVCPPAKKELVSASASSVALPGPDCLPTCQAVYTSSLGNCYVYAFLPVQYSACLLGAQQTLAACSAKCMVPGGVAAPIEAKNEVTAAPVKMGGVTCMPDCQAAYANNYVGCYWNINNPVLYTACVVSAGQQLSGCIQQCVTPGAPNKQAALVGDSFDCVVWGREQMDYAWTVCTTDKSTLEACLTRSAQVWSKNYLDCVAKQTPTVKVSSPVAGRLARRRLADSAKECELQFSYCMSACESALQSCTGHTDPDTCGEWYKECTVPLFKNDDSCTSKLQRCNEKAVGRA